MKRFLLALWISFTWVIPPAFACQIQAPSSEVNRYIEAASVGQGVPPLYSCKDKPKEVCHCLDAVDDWAVMKISAGDSGEDVLVTDPEKEKAKASKIKEQESDMDKSLQEKKVAKENFKNCVSGIDGATTTAAKIVAVRSCFIDAAKILKD